MATHLCILAWIIPWTEETERLQFMGLQRIGHDLATEYTLTVCVYIHLRYILDIGDIYIYIYIYIYISCGVS